MPPDYDYPWREPHVGLASDTVPQQIVATLLRQRRAGLTFDMAWKCVRRQLQLPHDSGTRSAWYTILDDVPFVDMCWRNAYEGRPVGGMDILRDKLDRLDQVGESEARRRYGEGGARPRARASSAV